MAACAQTVQGLGQPGLGWVGLRADGSVWWGSPGQRSAVLGFDVASLADLDGETTTPCAVKSDGTLWCWGRNDHGQVGDGTTIDRATPVPITALSAAVTQAAVSYTFGCALLADRTVWCWGGNQFGQLGDGTTQPSLVPVQVTGIPSDIVQVSAGFVHVCVRTEGGELWCWGGNNYGEVGVGAFGTVELTPTQVMTGIDYVSAGGFFTCAIDGARALWCWGDNADGHLGIGSTGNESTPQLVTTLGNEVLDVDTAVRSACAVKTDGSVWCWGWQDRGRLGDGVNADAAVLIPSRVSGTLGSGGATHVRATEAGACAVTATHDLWCWGTGAFLDGQGLSTVPVEVAFCSLPDVLDVAPTSGAAAGGTQVVITGTDFEPGATVVFDETPAPSVTFVNAQTLRAMTPAHDPGLVDIVVELSGGRKATVADGYTYVAAPSIYSVVPNVGPASGGSACTIEGAYIQAGATVTVGGAPATGVQVEGLTSATFVTGAGLSGSADVVLTNPDGQIATLTDGFLYVAAPEPESVDPAQGTRAGGTLVTIAGTGFTWSTAISFGGSPATGVTFIDATSLAAVTPAHALGTVDIVAVNDDGQTGTLVGGYTYVDSPDPDGGTGGVGGTGGGDFDAGGDVDAGGGGTGAPAASDDEVSGCAWACRTSANGRDAAAGAAWLVLALIGAGWRRRARDA